MKKLARFKIAVVVLLALLMLAPAAVVSANGVVNGGGDNDVLTVTKTLDCWEQVTGTDSSTVDLGEVWNFGLLITVTNNSNSTIYGVVVKDRLGGDLKISDDYDFPLILDPDTGIVETYTKGNSDKLFLNWTVVEDLSPGESAVLKFVVSTDINPGGHQEYTSPGTHCLNSGATAKGVVVWTDAKGRERSRQVSAESDHICITVPGPPTPI